MIKMYSQLDPKWCRLMLGNTPYTIKSWGCTISSICILISKLWNAEYAPDKAAKEWAFDSQGRLYWGSVKWKSEVDSTFLKYVGRYYQKPKDEIATEFTKSDKGMIVELNRSPRHWVFVHSWGASFWPFFMAVDPLKGKIVRLPKSQVVGFALFRKA